MSQGRESPDPQRQTGTQLHNHPGQGLHSENKTKGQVEESSKSQLGVRFHHFFYKKKKNFLFLFQLIQSIYSQLSA
jgi:hypothetical protein